MATTTEIQNLPAQPEQASLKNRSVPLQDLTPSGITLNDLPGPGAHNVATVQKTWRYPRINTWRLAAVFFAYVNFGMNDACYGALILYVGAASDLISSAQAD